MFNITLEFCFPAEAAKHLAEHNEVYLEDVNKDGKLCLMLVKSIQGFVQPNGNTITYIETEEGSYPYTPDHRLFVRRPILPRMGV